MSCKFIFLLYCSNIHVISTQRILDIWKKYIDYDVKTFKIHSKHDDTQNIFLRNTIFKKKWTRRVAEKIRTWIILVNMIHLIKSGNFTQSSRAWNLKIEPFSKLYHWLFLRHITIPVLFYFQKWRSECNDLFETMGQW